MSVHFQYPERAESKGHPASTCASCSQMTRMISDIQNMVDGGSRHSMTNLPLPDTPDQREGMSDIHFVLLPGYQVSKERRIKLSDLPWIYQCGIESAVRTGSKVTFWYRGFRKRHVIDDITTDGTLQLKYHTFQKGTQTGDWWFAHSKNNTLDCPNSEVTVSDYVRQDILLRFGGIYMDLDMIILDDRLPHGPDGVPAQLVNYAWKDHALVGNYMKYSPTTRFCQCMFDTWELHWDAYLKHHAECAGRCSPPEGDRDFDQEWGFMGPSLVTHAYLSCQDGNISVYPPSAFGNHPWPCNMGLLSDDTITLKGNAYALHTCHALVSAVDQMGGNMKRDTTMANVMQDRCPATSMRLYSGDFARGPRAYFPMHP